MTQNTSWFFHPIFVFVFSIIALSLSLVLYIYWYVEASAGLMALARHYQLDPKQFLNAQTWVVILVLSVLMAIILAGTIIVFVYGQKMVRLYRLQHDFINNFTHELKTPVTSMKLYLETFLKHDLQREEQIKYIHYMLQDADRLSSNINRILNLARIETKTYSGEFVHADLVQTVEQFQQNNAHLFQNCDIRIHNPSGASFPYFVNLPLFEILLMNLVTNCIKYNKSERPSLDIRFITQKQKIHICFEDNGIGIKKSDIKKIFKKFYQVDQSDSMTIKGSGLGLYLVQNIARIHNGKVIVKAREGGDGSVFTVILPWTPV
jgi:two-component system, OmpR family, phosphate regulon sensor histidine kinase PhoR